MIRHGSSLLRRGSAETAFVVSTGIEGRTRRRAENNERDRPREDDSPVGHLRASEWTCNTSSERELEDEEREERRVQVAR